MTSRTTSRLVGVLTLALLLAPTAGSFAGEMKRPSKANPATASSSATVKGKAVCGPENLMDGKSGTAWCEGVAGEGIGESVGLYLGDAALMGGPQDVVVHVSRGMQKDYGTYQSNGKPTKLKVELLADDRVLASAVGDIEHAFAEVTLSQVPPAKGSLWLRTTIVEVDPASLKKATCISEIRPEFKKANPHNIREFANRICDLVNNPRLRETNRDLKALVKQIRNYFINEFEDKAKPHCSMGAFSVLSETDFELWGAEMGDGATILRFRGDGLVWKLIAAGGFTLWD